MSNRKTGQVVAKLIIDTLTYTVTRSNFGEYRVVRYWDRDASKTIVGWSATRDRALAMAQADWAQYKHGFHGPYDICRECGHGLSTTGSTSDKGRL